MKATNDAIPKACVQVTNVLAESEVRRSCDGHVTELSIYCVIRCV